MSNVGKYINLIEIVLKWIEQRELMDVLHRERTEKSISLELRA